MATELYQIRTVSQDVLRIVKFDLNINVISIYHLRKQTLGRWWCPCPRPDYARCRHKIMRDIFAREDKIDTGWFYNWDTGLWVPPIGDKIKLNRVAAS